MSGQNAKDRDHDTVLKYTSLEQTPQHIYDCWNQQRLVICADWERLSFTNVCWVKSLFAADHQMFLLRTRVCLQQGCCVYNREGGELRSICKQHIPCKWQRTTLTKFGLQVAVVPNRRWKCVYFSACFQDKKLKKRVGNILDLNMFFLWKALIVHTVCANFGLNVHTVCTNFGLNVHTICTNFSLNTHTVCTNFGLIVHTTVYSVILLK